MNKEKAYIFSYDIDGVINLDDFGLGLRPSSEDDIIITGRSYEERDSTIAWLSEHGITNQVFFNPLPYEEKTRVTSGIHKGTVLNNLKDAGYDIHIHYEDDEVQIAEIEKLCPWVNIIHVKSDLVEKENVRR